ncbi:MAG TPA: dehydrogenase, partial [Verrucomicrobiota bacterium]|nr:dehydrogenase [Verrucomicrobiota bacterium]
MLPRLVLIIGLVGRLALAQAEFPTPFDSESRGAPTPVAEAVGGIHLPSSFEAKIFAAEPDVRQPIAMAFDPRGRLWVAENYTYAEAKVNFATQLNDRILILADTNHDGRFDQRMVFWDQAKILTSVMPGNGGVYVLCPPRLLFIADRNQDDVPDGEPEVLLDGFNTTTGNRHTFANGLKWGPDGWLWGRIGISSGAKIGPPDQPESDRVEMRGGVWRYHPQRRVFEAVSHGTTNPWGLDWNEVGEPFFINTVIGHLWHAIPGAHFQRMHGDDVNLRSYVLIDQHADHYHFDTGAGWTKSRATPDGKEFAAGSDQLGGGHAHSGLMIYLGANWPEPYRDHLFTLNFHGRRVNQERLERVGSGYVGRHEPDFLTVADSWFRGLDLLYGPDGAVFISDWSDTGECHDHDGVHRSSGRIYRISYGTPARVEPENLATLSESKLVALLFDRNEWLGRQARRVLSDRALVGGDLTSARDALTDAFAQQTKAFGKLRAMWGLKAVGGLTIPWLLERTRDGDANVRSWAVRLLVDSWPMDDPSGRPTQVAAQANQAARPESSLVVARLVEMAKEDPSALVRLYLASALQRLSWKDRTPVAVTLLGHAEDATDHNLPLMLWYGIEPLVGARPDDAVRLAINGRIPQVRELIARRLGEDIETRPAALAALLQGLESAPATAQSEVVRGLSAALRGWRKAPAPVTWAAFATKASASSEAGLADGVRDLNVLFGDGRALDELRSVVLDTKADPASRRQALKTLLNSDAPQLTPLLKQMADDNSLRPSALVGLLQLGAPEAAALATSRYQWLGLEDRS